VDDITTRTIVIAVNIFVTIAIVTLLITMFLQMQEIYGTVVETDTSIYNKFDDVYSMYNGKVETGIGLLNTLKKYEEQPDEKVIIKYPDSDIIREYIDYENLYETEEKNIIREVVYLKELMKKEKVHSYNEKRGTHEFRLENKYNVTVFENEQEQTITINYQSIN